MNRRNYTYQFYIFITCCLFSLVACQKDELVENASSEREEISVEFNYNIVPLKNEGSDDAQTKANVSDSKMVCKDIWVFQFDRNNRIVGYPKYYSGQSQDHFSLFTGQQQKIVIIANTHNYSIKWDVKTLDDLTNRTRKIANITDLKFLDNVDALLNGMVGNVDINKYSNKFTFNLFRTLSKVKVKVNNYVEGAKIKGIALCNIPNGVNLLDHFAKKTEHQIYPNFNDRSSSISETINYSLKEYTNHSWIEFYTTRNQQGVTRNTSVMNKNIDAPSHATYIKVIIEKGQNLYQYIIYPGANDYNDFNIIPNKAYATEFTISSLNEATLDPRCTTALKVFTPNESDVNSFIINPNKGLLYAFYPHVQVNKFWSSPIYSPSASAAERTNNVINDNDEWTAQVEWQDVQSANGVRRFFTITDKNGNPLELLSKHRGQEPLYIKIDEKCKNVEANVVVSVLKNYKVLWSWHFWITKYNPNSSPNYYDEHTCDVTGGELHQYSDSGNGNEGNLYAHFWEDNPNKYIMDRNLGARSTEANLLNRNNAAGILYYQYGNKNPHVLYSTDERLDQPIYSNNGVKMTKKGTREGIDYGLFFTDQTTQTQATIVKLVNKPTYYNIPCAKNWCSVNQGNRYPWNDPSKQLGEKSIFDPCPKGWKVPSKGIWSDFDRYNTSYSNFGYFYEQSVFYPIVGHLSHEQTEINKNDSYYWTDTPYDSEKAYSFSITKSGGRSNGVTVNPSDHSYRGNSLPVRCIQE